MGGTMFGAIVFVAFRWAEGEGVKPDSDRELIARISGIKFKPMIAWAFAAFCSLLLAAILREWGNAYHSVPSGVALAAGAGAVAGGRSHRSGDLAKKAGSRLLKILPMSSLIALATMLFIAALLVLLGSLEVYLAGRIQEVAFPKEFGPVASGLLDPVLASHLVLAAILAGLVWLFGRMIPVNRFSLQGLYRNRLARGFLGAARPRRGEPGAPKEAVEEGDPRAPRYPNPFTGFDSSDNVRVHRVRPFDEPAEQKPRRLYPVINCALNATATDNLAWQERKAQPFIFSPLFSGSGSLGKTCAGGAGRDGAYVRSDVYGGSEPDLGLGKGSAGISLATAMSISGAAASPNMGYHSSPATAFLMTLFNVRLGAWLPNPALANKAGEDMGRSSPKNSLMAMLRELGGSTTDCGPDVYLSDGGHFENLAVYEMLRRRCRYIMVTDAGADPTFALGDLGGLVRKAKIDFDCEIDFGRMCMSGRDKDIDPQLAWAIGTIVYKDGSPGTILYVKPSYFGQELPVDVVAYAKQSATFPHETTGDQFFSESQFESYRRLGHYWAGRLAPGAKLPEDQDAKIARFFAAAGVQYEREKEKKRAAASTAKRKDRAGPERAEALPAASDLSGTGAAPTK
jgi:hypothetical protein